MEARNLSPNNLPHDLIDASVDGIITFDFECRYTAWNRAMERISGVRREDVIGRRAFDVFPFLKETGEDRYFHEALTGRSVVAAERTYTVPETGRQGYFDGYYSPLRNEQGQIIGGVAIIHDITAHKKAAEALRASEERYRAFIANSSEGIWRFELEQPVPVSLATDEQIELFYRHGYLAECNDAMARMYGYERSQEITGARLGDLLVRDDPKNLEYLRSFIHSGYRLTDIESVEVDREGQPKIFSNNLVSVIENGHVLRAWGTQRDVTERQQAHESLKLHWRVLDSMTEGVSVTDEGGFIIYTNPAEDEMFGYARGELVGQHVTVQNTYPPEENARRVQEVIEQLQTKGLWSGEWSNRRKDGTPFITYAHITALEISGRKHWVCVQADVTEQKRAAQELQATEHRFQMFMENLPGLAWIKDHDGRYMYANVAAAQAFRIERSELYGRTDDDLFPPETAAHFMENDRLALRQGGLQVVETLEQEDGVHHSIVSKFPFQGPGGELTLVGGIAIDITEQKRAEDALRASEAELRALFAAMTDVVLVLGGDGRYLKIAPTNPRLLYKPPAELRGRTLHEVLPPTQADFFLWHVRRALETRQPHTVEYDLRIGTTEIWFEGSISPMTENAVFWIARDITERKRAEEEKERLLASEQHARAAAEEASRLKDEFLATISHELRTPLTAILGWAHMLRTGTLEDGSVSATRALETIERNARAQAQLIDDLLDVSRIITGKLRLDVRPIDPSTFIEAAIEAVRPAAEAKGLRIEKIMDTGLVSVAGDPIRLQQVIWNLLSNAIKFTPKGGRMQIRLARVNSHVEIVVSDNGAGISPAFLPHVFDRFRQADQRTTRQHGGLGLGLAIVRHLVELHGGTVHAESPGEDQGSIFTVRLPVVPVYQADDSGERVHPAARDTLPAYECQDRLDGLRVLIVDDEPDTLEMLRVGLTQCGAEVTVASSASKALEALRANVPDILISDIGMPEEDGYDLIRNVRALLADQGGKVPAIALTAYSRTEDRMQALRAGYQMHVPKPVELAELVAIAAILTRRAA